MTVPSPGQWLLKACWITGKYLAHRLMGAFNGQDRSQLVHIATDGETYGHHHHHGEMALAYALDYIESNRSGPVDQLR